MAWVLHMVIGEEKSIGGKEEQHPLSSSLSWTFFLTMRICSMWRLREGDLLRWRWISLRCDGIIDWQIQGTRWRKNRMTTHFWHAVPWEGILHGWLPSQLQYPIPFLRQKKKVKPSMRIIKGNINNSSKWIRGEFRIHTKWCGMAVRAHALIPVKITKTIRSRIR